MNTHSVRPWTAHSWNEALASPHLLHGVVETGVAVGEPGAAASLAISFIEQHGDLFPATPADLSLAAAENKAGKWSVTYAQRHRGVRVVGGLATVVMTESGRVFALENSLYPGIDVRIEPLLSSLAAESRAVAALGAGGTEGVMESELVVLPLLQSSGPEYHLSWQVRHGVSDPPGDWISFVDARTGDVLWRYNRVHDFDFLGSVEGDVDFPDYCAGIAPSHPMANMTVTVEALPSTTTASDGSWIVPYGGPIEVRPVTVRFEGPFFDVNIFPDGSSDSEITEMAVSGNSEFIYLDFSNTYLEERDAWRFGNRIHDWIKGLDPGFTAMDYQAPLWINRTDGLCPGNAWYNSADGSVNFCAAGGPYANTAQIGDVFYHEYTHGVTHHLFQPPFVDPPDAVDEGNSDLAAVLLNNSPLIARGLVQGACATGIRSAANNLIYPDSLSGQAHHDGQIIAGFMWDAYQELVVSQGTVDAARAVAGQLWHFSRVLGHPITMPDQVFWTFVADDDNGDLGDGTPHYGELCFGAGRHGFFCPETDIITIQHTEIESGTFGHVTISAIVTATQAPIQQVTAYYRVDGGGFLPTVLVPEGNDEYSVLLAGLNIPSEVEYYILAEDGFGNTKTAPHGAPLALYGFDAATVFDDLETDLGWVVNLEGIDTAAHGFWERCDPNGTIAQPEDDHTVDPGAFCWVTGDTVAGASGSANDVDGGATTLYTPPYNLSGAVDVTIKYWRWYSNDKGPAPGVDTWFTAVRNGPGPWITIENTAVSSNDWVSVRADIGHSLGGLDQVQVKFVASDSGAPSTVEAAVDDFTILADFGGTIDVEVAPTGGALPPEPYLAGAVPNPLRARAILRYGLDDASPVSLSVYDVAGRRVASLVDTVQPAGNYSVVWDGRASSGDRVPAGVYYVRLVTRDLVRNAKLLVVR